MMNEAILKGMRIIEISAFVAAPTGGLTMAQLGAEVIRVDPLVGGLDYRRWPITEDNVSMFWAGLNKGKRSVTVDISKPEGRELVQALITAPGEEGGMLLTNFPPKGWLDYEALRSRREDVIQLTILGDHKGGSAVDYTVNPRVGMTFLTGPEDYNGVVNSVLPAWDLITGHLAAVGLLAAEWHRMKTGEGQHVKLPLEDVALAMMANLGFIAEAERGVERPRYGNDLFGSFGRDFPTSDGERVMIVALTLKQWRALCKATGIGDAVPALADRLGLDLDDQGNRFRARNEIAELLGPWVAERTLSEVATAFDTCGVCWGRYQTVSQLITDDPAASLSNSLFSRICQPGFGETLTPANPLNFDGYRLPPAPAPVLGADTEEIVTRLLGLSSAEYGRLTDQGIVQR